MAKAKKVYIASVDAAGVVEIDEVQARVENGVIAFDFTRKVLASEEKMFGGGILFWGEKVGQVCAAGATKKVAVHRLESHFSDKMKEAAQKVKEASETLVKFKKEMHDSHEVVKNIRASGKK